MDAACNGREALQMFLSGDYDVVISDCHMPEMDGFELAQKITARRRGKRPWLIALTADAQSSAAQRCLAAGFDDYIAKPCPLELLRNKLQLPPSRPTEATSPLIAETLLDRAHVIALSDGDIDMIRDVLAVYLDINGSERDALQQSLQQGDLESVVDIAHRIKGTIRYLGGDRSGALAQQVENAAKQSNQAQVDPLVTRLLSQLLTLEHEVQVWHAELQETQHDAHPMPR